MNLFKASNQWATRPKDERFMTIQEMLDVCYGYYQTSAEATVEYADLRVQAVGEDIRLLGKEEVPARLSNWAFSQLVARAVPQDSGRVARYLRGLPATLAAQNVNHGLKRRAAQNGERKVQLLMNNGDDLLLRAVTSDIYSRFWNWQVAERLVGLQGKGWLVPPAMATDMSDERNRTATEADLAPFGDTTTVGVGTLIGPAGIYASDHDLFVFTVRPDRSIDAGGGRMLSRGAFFWNSEVGDKSLGVQTFLYDYSCANHIVWDVQDVKELRIAHVGDSTRIQEYFSKVELRLTQYADDSASDLEAKIKQARTTRIAMSKEEVLDALFGQVDVSKKQLTKAYELCEANEDGDPMSYWGMTSGLTRLSQDTPYTDQRVAMDRSAGKVLRMSF